MPSDPSSLEPTTAEPRLAANVRIDRRYFLGVDLGQTVDPTAIAIVERERRSTANLDDRNRAVWNFDGLPTFNCRYLERLPLHTSYPAIIGHVGRLMSRPPIAGNVTIVIDQTGVGRPVFDMFAAAGIDATGVTITAGDAQVAKGNTYHVAKSLLVSRLTAVLHDHRLKVAKSLPDAAALVHELQDFRATVSESGAWRFGARAGQHDDLVLALAIAVWRAHEYGSTGIFEYYRQMAEEEDSARAIHISATQLADGTTVKLKASTYVTHVYGIKGHLYQMGDDFIIDAHADDVAPLVANGFTRVEEN